MPTQYYNRLLQTLIPEGEIAQLQYDIQNAPPAMSSIANKLFNAVTILVYHNVALTEELLRLNVLQRIPPKPAQAARATAPATLPTPQTLSPFPSPPSIPLPFLTVPPAASGSAPGEPAPCDVAQVVITTAGTKVIPPAGTGAAPVVLPPNTPVDLTKMQGQPTLPPAPDGSPQVVLPPGGVMSPEVQAALNTRQGGTP
jgi:hypothetical protein